MATADTWSRGRWTGMIVLLLIGQITVIYWLSIHRSPALSPVAPPPLAYLSAQGNEQWPGVSDASQFVLANEHGFSRLAWLQVQPLEYALPEWTEPPLPLALSVAKMDAALAELTRPNLTTGFELTPRADPQMEVVIPVDPVEPAPSHLTLEGALENRPLLSHFTLPAWPATEILTNSVVQTGVDEQGVVFSAILLASCGSRPADARALELARAARFEPLRWSHSTPKTAPLVWGNLVFHWQTIAPPETRPSTAP